MQETQVQSSLGGEDPLAEGRATHSSILAWRMPWTEEPGGLQSSSKELHMELQRVGHDGAQPPPHIQQKLRQCLESTTLQQKLKTKQK